MIRLDDQDEVVYVQLIDFGRNVRASEAITPNDDGSFTIFVNSRLSATRQKEAVEHALLHIGHHDFQKTDVQQIEAEAHGLTVPEPPITEDSRMKRYEEMRKKNARARKRIQKQLARKQRQVEYLLETDNAYRKDHDIFGI